MIGGYIYVDLGDTRVRFASDGDQFDPHHAKLLDAALASGKPIHLKFKCNTFESARAEVFSVCAVTKTSGYTLIVAPIGRDSPLSLEEVPSFSDGGVWFSKSATGVWTAGQM